MRPSRASAAATARAIEFCSARSRGTANASALPVVATAASSASGAYVGKRDARALGGQQFGGRAADAARRAGDENASALVPLRPDRIADRQRTVGRAGGELAHDRASS